MKDVELSDYREAKFVPCEASSGIQSGGGEN